MLLRKWADKYDRLLHANALFKFLIVSMSAVIAIQSYTIYLVMQRSRTILVPPRITTPMTFTDMQVPDAYLRDWVYYVSSLAFQHSPQTARHQFHDLLGLYHPDSYVSAKAMWMKLAGDIEHARITTTFIVSPGSIQINPGRKTLVFQGRRTRYQDRVPVSNDLMEYTVNYALEYGKFSISGITEREVQG